MKRSILSFFLSVMAFSAFTEVLAEKNYQDYQRVPNIQPPPPPPPQNPTGYVYPTAPGGQPEAPTPRPVELDMTALRMVVGGREMPMSP